jgi:23S rRNA (cytidine1920-2'-O)/16S rRNA (cytidine1409-2'-O)-methyltransferase
MARARLDQLLVARGHFSSRARARDAVLRGCVTVEGKVATKHGQMVDEDATIGIDDPAQRYVARSALKLVAALDAFDITVEGLHALDVGQSTGGFTQVLLERGADHVTGIDVGTGQLDASLRNHTQVTFHEGVNARNTDALPDGPFDLAVVDVSFISLSLVLPALIGRLAENAPIIALFKPQFEVGKAHIGKGGLVSDDMATDRALTRLLTELEAFGWGLAASIRSPLPGGDGNVERLLHLVPSP